VETEVLQNVQKAKDLQLKNAVLFQQNPELSHFVSSLLNREFVEPRSSFTAHFCLQSFFIHNSINYFFVYANNYDITENDDSTFTISSGGRTRTFENDKTFFIYPLKNINSSYAIDRHYYFSYEDFKAASIVNITWRLFNLTPHYTHLDYHRDADSYLTFQNEYYQFYERITHQPLIAVNCGILEGDDAQGFYPDKHYQDTAGENINYGFLGDDHIYHHPYVGNPKGYLYSNRHGAKFSYKFSGLPEKRLSLYIDILELWAIRKGERVFSIEIETAQGKIFYRDIDPLDIANNFLSANKKLPFRLYFDLPHTPEVVITFAKNEDMPDYSLPFINGIGLAYY
jgi:hypothetical protein